MYLEELKNNLNVFAYLGWNKTEMEEKNKNKNRGEVFLVPVKKTITFSVSMQYTQLPSSGAEVVFISYQKLLLCAQDPIIVHHLQFHF